MPIDHKRIQGPTDVFFPQDFAPAPLKTKLLSAKLKRHDRRALEDIRPIFLRCNLISQAKGSAYMEVNKTKVICAVYGPREIARRETFSMKGQLNCSFKFATFSCARMRQHQQDNQEKDLSVILLEALEPAVCLHKFPKAVVDITVIVLENDGSVLAAAITSASLALASAGIEMYDMVLGCSLRQFGEHKLMDPSLDEEYHFQQEDNAQNHGNVTVGLMPSRNQISAFVQDGELQPDVVVQALRHCAEGCQKIYPLVQQCLVRAIKHKVKIEEN